MKAFISCVVGIVVLLTFSIEAVALDDDPNLDPRLPIEDESVSEEDVSDLIEEQMDEQLDRLGFTEIEQFWEDIRRDYESFLPESQKGSFTDFLDGDQQFSPTEWGRALLNFLFHELTANVNLLGTLILLAVFSMVLKALQNAFEHAAVSKVAYSVTFTVLIVISMNSFLHCDELCPRSSGEYGSFHDCAFAYGTRTFSHYRRNNNGCIVSPVNYCPRQHERAVN